MIITRPDAIEFVSDLLDPIYNNTFASPLPFAVSTSSVPVRKIIVFFAIPTIPNCFYSFGHNMFVATGAASAVDDVSVDGLSGAEGALEWAPGTSGDIADWVGDLGAAAHAGEAGGPGGGGGGGNGGHGG